MRTFVKLFAPRIGATLRAVLIAVATTTAMLFAGPAIAKAPTIPDGPIGTFSGTAIAFVVYAGFHTAGGECSVGLHSAQCTSGKFAGVRVVITETGVPIYSTGPFATGYGPCGPGYWSSPMPGICNIAISDDMNHGRGTIETKTNIGTCTTEKAKLTYGFPKDTGSHSSSTVDGSCSR